MTYEIKSISSDIVKIKKENCSMPKSDLQINIKSIMVSIISKKFHRTYVGINNTIHNA